MLVALCTPAVFPHPSTAASLLLAAFRRQRCVPGRDFPRPATALGVRKVSALRHRRLFLSREANVSRETSNQDGAVGFCGRNNAFLHETALATSLADLRWHLAFEKHPRLRIGRQFLAISARLYALHAPSAAFLSQKRRMFHVKQAGKTAQRLFAGEACLSGETDGAAFSAFFETLWLFSRRRRSKRPSRSVARLKSGVSRETNGYLGDFLGWFCLF